MVTAVKIRAKVVTDNTGVASEVPALVTESGVLDPLLDYLLLRHRYRSLSWMNQVVHATYLLLQYMEANQDCFRDPMQLFQSFADRIYSGTVGDDGLDPSGLYWLPASVRTGDSLIRALTGLTDWMARKLGTQQLNPLSPADSDEKRLAFAAWFRRNQHDFLGHIARQGENPLADQARHIRGRRPAIMVHGDAIAFPERLFSRFITTGLAGAQDRRAAVRNQLIVFMMHFAGCRESDALHLWIEDVLIDPQDPVNVIVRLYHPEYGKAPNAWKSRNGATNRAAYLKENYALTPRNRLTGTKRVGWKSRVVDHQDNYIQLYWFPREAGVYFARLWREYLLYVAQVDRHHPYAFISFEPRALGEPLTLNAFNDAYAKAMLRIGERPCKSEGRSPHAHRHAMGRRLHTAGVAPRIIQKALHHSALSSQTPYTTPGIRQITQVLDTAYANLQQKAERGETTLAVPDWTELLQYGFEDIDPDGLFSGPYPIFTPGRQ